ncbi:guanine deaminase [Desulfocapsa sulfexigens DSM 10523]|uniref:Guanine deaminase n=1 Tax=Desulfocapsa sulfexigens (strain DSM 10523 / SB164P1) TaxID=1167006 RepID=M1NDS7_DESSD|nr:guanine deaminase [Desulfocapsa sulfexigens DSM 10523]
MVKESQTTAAIRGQFLDFADVADCPSELADTVRHLKDGLLLLRNGHIEWFGDWEEGRDKIAENCPVHQYPDKLIVPGFIDAHIHYPQAEIVGAHGEQLLEWLENYAFPAERKYQDKAYAAKMADFFIDQLLRNGTTTAMVFCTVHPESVEALFTAAEKQNMRIIAGKIMMDRNAPQYLLDTPESSYDASRKLIEKWHKRGRLLYAITPRFAPTSSPEQLEMAGRLKKEFPDTYMQTHLSENADEIKWVRTLFPERSGYLDVYHHYGLTGTRCVFAHCVYLEDQEWDSLLDTDSAIAFCPTSNLFLGSGLFDLNRAREKQVNVAIATDIGGGTSFSMLKTLSEAYKVMQLQKQKFSAYEAFYSATLGGARALSLDHLIGNFSVGKEADFVVLDPAATVLQAKRLETSKNIADLLFNLIILGDDRSIFHTYVNGCLVHKRDD